MGVDCNFSVWYRSRPVKDINMLYGIRSKLHHVVIKMRRINRLLREQNDIMTLYTPTQVPRVLAQSKKIHKIYGLVLD